MKSFTNLQNSKAAKQDRQQFYTKFLEKSDAIFISFSLVSSDSTFELISILYDDLTTPLPSNYELFKLLIKNEQMVLFDRLLSIFQSPEGYNSYNSEIKESDEVISKKMR
jgi:hypothetical protein